MPTVKPPKLSKSDFVRQQPSTLTAPEVVKKAKAAGIKLSTQLVYVVRGRASGKGKKSAGPGRSGPSTSGKTTSKAAFVRGLPASTAASEVVRQAKAAGIKLGVSYVYNFRGAAKMAAKKKRAAAKSPAVSAIVNGGASKVSASAENLLTAVAAEIGLGRAIELLQGERGWVHSIMRN
jgi:hypothetical protein